MTHFSQKAGHGLAVTSPRHCSKMYTIVATMTPKHKPVLTQPGLLKYKLHAGINSIISDHCIFK